MLTKCSSTLSYYFPTMGLTAGKSACKPRASSDHKTAYTVVSFDGRRTFHFAIVSSQLINIFTEQAPALSSTAKAIATDRTLALTRMAPIPWGATGRRRPDHSSYIPL